MRSLRKRRRRGDHSAPRLLLLLCLVLLLLLPSLSFLPFPPCTPSSLLASPPPTRPSAHSDASPPTPPSLPPSPLPRALYIHLPFCRRRCFYCDFPIKVVGDGAHAADEYSEAYINLLLREMQAAYRRTAEDGGRAEGGGEGGREGGREG
ncbi:oxygen-independent coproporphyrinogen iii oxidase, partial [Nannochloropsis gaditana]